MLTIFAAKKKKYKNIEYSVFLRYIRNNMEYERRVQVRENPE